MTDQPSGEVVFYQPAGVPALEVRLDADTVWLSQQQIADLFQSSRTNIVEHIRNAYDEDELDEFATSRKFRQVRTEGTRQVGRELPFYNLDLIALADATGNSAQARKPGRPCGAPNYGLWRHDRMAAQLPRWGRSSNTSIAGTRSLPLSMGRTARVLLGTCT